MEKTEGLNQAAGGGRILREGTGNESGMEMAPKTRTATQRVGAATGFIAGAGRATECAARHIAQCMSAVAVEWM